jgi:hypothetical protein
MLKRGAEEAVVATEMEKWQMAQAERRQRDDARKARRLAARRKAKKPAEAEVAPAAAPASEPQA